MPNEVNLKQLVERLVGAMKASVEVGCTDHLDCCNDAGDFWHGAIEEAETLLGHRIPPGTI